MRQTIKDNFSAFTAQLEGAVPWMYQDQLGLVTTGLGNLIDSVGAAQALPWRHGENGPLATPAEVSAAWMLAKGATTDSQGRSAKATGGGQPFWGTLSDLRLDAAGISQLVSGKLDQVETDLKGALPAWETWPADAQLATLSMAWAMGSGFVAKFPSWKAAVTQNPPNWAGAAAQSHMQGVGIDDRNEINKELFLSAVGSSDPNEVQWPTWQEFLAKGRAALTSGSKSRRSSPHAGS